MKRWQTVLLLVLVTVGAVIAAILIIAPSIFPPDLEGGVLTESDEVLPDFTLTNSDGAPVALSTWRGKYMLVYFGYTHCPDVCPTTLSDLARATEDLGPLAERTQVVFITVDPERDTPERMAQYVHAFEPSFVGLTGTVDEIREVATAYGAGFQKEESSSAAGYLMSHSAHVTVVDPQGRSLARFSYGVPGDVIAQDMRLLMR